MRRVTDLLTGDDDSKDAPLNVACCVLRNRGNARYLCVYGITNSVNHLVLLNIASSEKSYMTKAKWQSVSDVPSMRS